MTDKTDFSLAQPAYRLTPEEIATQLSTDLIQGLTKQEAKRRCDVVGENTLEGSGGVSIWKVLLRQVANALTLVSTPHILDDLTCKGTGNGNVPLIRNNRLG